MPCFSSYFLARRGDGEIVDKQSRLLSKARWYMRRRDSIIYTETFGKVELHVQEGLLLTCFPFELAVERPQHGIDRRERSMDASGFDVLQRERKLPINGGL